MHFRQPNKYGARPPVTAPRVIDPLEAPQEAFTIVVTTAVGPEVLVTVAVVANTQLLASLTCTAYVPAVKPEYQVLQ